MRNLITILLLGLFLPLSAAAQSETSTIGTDENILMYDTAIVDSLRSVINSLSIDLQRHRDLLDVREREIDNLKKEIEDLKQIDVRQKDQINNLKDQNDGFKKELVSMASNFLYIPYEEYSIDSVAIPAYLAVKGTPVFETYKIRYELLTNYRNDLTQLIRFLGNAHSELTNSILITSMKEDKAKELLTKLQSDSVHIRYSQYQYWKETYLGKKIVEIEQELQLTSTKSIDKCVENLENIRARLETLIKE